MNSPYDNLVPNYTDPTPTKPQPLETNMNGKPLRKSKTFWINLVTIFAGLVTSVGGSEMIQQNPEYAGYAATALGIVNILMRMITKSPVTGI